MVKRIFFITKIDFTKNLIGKKELRPPTRIFSSFHEVKNAYILSESWPFELTNFDLGHPVVVFI